MPCSTYYQAHGTVSMNNARFGDKITVKCGEGYMLENSNQTTKEMVCSAKGHWLGDNSVCTGKRRQLCMYR